MLSCKTQADMWQSFAELRITHSKIQQNANVYYRQSFSERPSRQSGPPRQMRQAPAGEASPPQDAGKANRQDRKKKPTKKYEKPDIEKLRQSRYERRQQRQERNEANAIEQVCIFKMPLKAASDLETYSHCSLASCCAVSLVTSFAHGAASTKGS